MYKKPNFKQTSIVSNDSVEGESIETKIERMMNNKERIENTAPLIYTERSEGIGAAFNIRTDRFEIAVEAKDKIHKSAIARREANANMKVIKNDGLSAETEPTQGTGN